MVSEMGGLAATRRLLAAPVASDGFTALWDQGRLDLTVETLVVSEQYRELFSDDEREGTAARLAAIATRATEDHLMGGASSTRG